MFFCRHLFRRAHIPKPLFLQLRPQASFANTRSAIPFHRHVHASPTPRAALPDGENKDADEGGEPDAASPPVQGVEAQTEAPPSVADTAPRETTSVKQAKHREALDAYFTPRNEDRLSVAYLDLEVVRRALRAAVQTKRVDLLQDIADDVLEVYRGSLNRHRTYLKVDLLALCCDPWWRKSQRQHIIQRVLQDLDSHSLLHEIPKELVATIARTCLLRSPTTTLNMPTLTIVTTVLLRQLGGMRTANFGTEKGIPKAEIIWILFQLMARLLDLDKQPEVLEIFQPLVMYKVIPIDVLDSVEMTSDDFSSVILLLMVSTAHSFGWTTRSAQLLNQFLNITPTLSPIAQDTAEDVIKVLLQAPYQREIGMAAALIVRVINAGKTRMLSTAVLDDFYKLAHRGGLSPLAVTVYTAARASSARYPLPDDVQLNWLIRHCMELQDLATARLLAKQMVEDKKDVPYINRAQTLVAFASIGLTREVRILYERYAMEPDAKIVTANAGVLVRLVSLCVARARILEGRINGSLGSTATEVTDAPSPRERRAKDAAKDGARNDRQKDTPDIEYPETEFPTLAEGTVPDHSRMSLSQQLQDIRAFADRVIAAFVHAVSPLEHASHFQLNALARAYLLRGRVTLGFDALRVLLRRREVPNVQDVNVALSAMAARRPARAAQMLEQMLSLGLPPDSVSFGTVIHHADVHGEKQLVIRLLERAQELGVVIDYKTLCTLVRGAATTDDPPAVQLLKAQKIMASILDSGVYPTPKVAMDCVHVALLAEDAESAFGFWSLLVKDRMDWTDQARLRQLIIALVWRRFGEGKLDDARASAMLNELRHSTERWTHAAAFDDLNRTEGLLDQKPQKPAEERGAKPAGRAP